jgi:ribbon-helix-helix CopG family protein
VKRSVKLESKSRKSSGGAAMAETGKVRVQFDFSPNALKRLDDLKERSGATSRAETIRDALSLYEWFIKEVGEDDTVRVFDSNGDLHSAFKARLLRKR